MFKNKPRIGQELLDVPMGEMIRDMAFSIAEAQLRLDENSIEVAEMMGGLKAVTDDEGVVTFQDSRVFFGKEKMTLSSAIDAYNTASDVGYKQDIKDKIDVDASIVTDDDGNELMEAKSGANKDKFFYISQRLSMMELGFAPTFYQFVDTIIECKIAIKYTQEGSISGSSSMTSTSKSGGISFGFRRGISASGNTTTTQVNASYSQKYSYSAEGSSLLRTKLVPIPPPPIMEERIRLQMEIAREKGGEA